jgi:hypothetical protein
MGRAAKGRNGEWAKGRNGEWANGRMGEWGEVLQNPTPGRAKISARRGRATCKRYVRAGFEPRRAGGSLCVPLQ